MIYQRYLRELKEDLRTANANLDDVMDSKPSLATCCSESAWDSAVVEHAIAKEKATQDVGMLEAMIDAIYSNEVKLGLQ